MPPPPRLHQRPRGLAPPGAWALGPETLDQNSRRGWIGPRPDLGALAPLCPGALNAHTPLRWVGEPRAVGVFRPPLRPPSSGTRRHLHTFRLARCSPFRPPRFQLLIWKRKKKPAGRGRPQGGNPSRGAAPAPPAPGAGCRRSSAPPGDNQEIRPPRGPPPACPTPSSKPHPALRGRGPPADPGTPKGCASAAEEGAPVGEAGRGPYGGRSPPLEPSSQEPSSQEPLPFPRSPAWRQPPLCP